MKLKQLILVMLMAVFVGMTSCEEGPSNVPTLPTSFSIEDGAIVEETNLILSASGGTVEDEGYSVEYKYYLGTSVDDLRLVGIRDKQEVKLEPFTQYFFAVKPVSVHASDSIEGEMSEIRTFYCVPPFEIETDNGEGEWAAILRFKGLDIKGGTVSAKGDHEGYNIDPITIPAGQDSCYIPMTRHTLSQYNAYVQWWDDKIGQYYEPVIYTFEVSLDIQVGDKVIPVKNTAKEIILDKNECVRDHEFNVYRVTTIGNQTWLFDDLRSTTYINKNGEIKKFQESEDYVISTLESGCTGVLYKASNIYEKKITCPKGYRIASDADWTCLETYLGVEPQQEIFDGSGGYQKVVVYIANELTNWGLRVLEVIKYGEEVELKYLLRSQYDWINEPSGDGPIYLNIKPWGDAEYGVGLGSIMCTINFDETKGPWLVYRILSDKTKGAIRTSALSPWENYQKGAVRCVKE